MMNRRNVLLFLGVIVLSGGLLLGSGAFSQVEAQRTVDVQTAGDGSAYANLTGDGLYTTTGSNGEVAMSFDRVNDNATTIVNDTLTITPNPPSGSDVSAYYVYIESDTGVGEGQALDLRDSSDNSIVGASNRVRLNSTSSGWESASVSAIINTSDSNIDNIDSITIHVTDSDPA